MTTRSLVGQFSKSDFFSVLPPGFYIFMVAFSCHEVMSPEESAPRTLSDVFDTLAGSVTQHPAVLIFILFACYLFGSIFRALPVFWAEKTIPPFTSDFPPADILKDVCKTLNKHAGATKHDPNQVPNVRKGIPTDVFNYWKDVLCVSSPEGFIYYQSFETRVRLFAGMIWSAWCGILGGLYVLVVGWCESRPVGFGMLVLSLVLLLSFGYNFRRVRNQEARALILIFTASQQHQVVPDPNSENEQN